jgi:GntR family transcriptional regulator
MTEWTSEGPAYQPVADDLRKKIRDGTIPTGAALPSIQQLETTYKVSPGIIRRALTELRTEGLIRSQQGIGSFVREELPPAEAAEGYRKLTQTLDAVWEEVRSQSAELAELRAWREEIEAERATRRARPGSPPPRQPEPKAAP